jgi:hypothetical protein
MARRAESTVAAARGDVGRRLGVAEAIYAPRPGRPSVWRYRRAMLAFMRWQAARGVFDPLGGRRPGSPWWQAINDGLLLDAWEASYRIDTPSATPSRRAVARWVSFLEDPSPLAWYRAHNASVVARYIEHRHLADCERPVERFFMDVALGRVLFVHALVADPRLALGRWLSPIGARLGDPRWPGAELYLSMRNILPDHYPLTHQGIEEILNAENTLGRVIDYGVLLPRAQALYELVAEDLDEAALLEFIRNGKLVYAWPYKDRHVWDLTRSVTATRIAARLTALA